MSGRIRRGDFYRVAKSVVLGMISWQTRVFVSKKEVVKKRYCAPSRAFSTDRDAMRLPCPSASHTCGP